MTHDSIMIVTVQKLCGRPDNYSAAGNFMSTLFDNPAVGWNAKHKVPLPLYTTVLQ